MILFAPTTNKCSRSPYKDDRHVEQTIGSVSYGGSCFTLSACSQCGDIILTHDSVYINWPNSYQRSRLEWKP